MEERVPPAGNASTDKDDPSANPSDPSNLYVVQIPRDQVYRVPPPENAHFIAHRSRNLPSQNSGRTCGPVCWFFIIIFILAAAAAASILIVRATLYKPKAPEFKVTGIKTKNLDQIFHPGKKLAHPPEYDITLRATNQNERLSVALKGGGKSSLIYKNQRIGNGGIPPTIKDGPHSSADIPVILYGKGVTLPPAVEKCLNATNEKIMQLRIEVPMEVNSWLRNQHVDLTVVCDFKVKNSLVNNKAKISFQECEANF